MWVENNDNNDFMYIIRQARRSTCTMVEKTGKQQRGREETQAHLNMFGGKNGEIFFTFLKKPACAPKLQSWTSWEQQTCLFFTLSGQIAYIHEQPNCISCWSLHTDQVYLWRACKTCRFAQVRPKIGANFAETHFGPTLVPLGVFYSASVDGCKLF